MIIDLQLTAAYGLIIAGISIQCVGLYWLYLLGRDGLKGLWDHE